MKKKGKLIILEGGEGSGKTSVINFLKEKFINNKDIVFTREPGGTTIGEKIRNLLMDKDNKDILPITELFLFCGARAQHMEELVIPSLNSGKSVISDRFDVSTIAYQLYGRGRPDLMNQFHTLNLCAKQGWLTDFVIWLDLDPEVGLSRKEKSQEGKTTRFDEEKLEFHRRAREGFRSCFFNDTARANSGSCINPVWYYIDTSATSLNEVKNKTFDTISKILNS